MELVLHYPPRLERIRVNEREGKGTERHSRRIFQLGHVGLFVLMALS